MRIGVGVHTVDSVEATVYFNHIQAFAEWSKKYDMAFYGTRRVKVAEACEVTVEALLRMGCTHVLFIDDDHMLPLGMLDKLTENADAGMVSGLICKRAFPYPIVAFGKSEDGKLYPRHLDPGERVVEVEACAFGCTLINMESLREVPRPWFVNTPERRFDVNFCLKVREAGKRVLVDTRVSIGHVVDPEIVWPENATELRARVLEKKLKEAAGV